MLMDCSWIAHGRVRDRFGLKAVEGRKNNERTMLCMVRWMGGFSLWNLTCHPLSKARRGETVGWTLKDERGSWFVHGWLIVCSCMAHGEIIDSH